MGGIEEGVNSVKSRYSLYIIIKFGIPSASGSLVLKQTKGVTDSKRK